LILEEVTDKNKLSPFYGPHSQCSCHHQGHAGNKTSYSLSIKILQFLIGLSANGGWPV